MVFKGVKSVLIKCCDMKGTIKLTMKGQSMYNKSSNELHKTYTKLTQKLQCLGIEKGKVPCYNGIMKNCIANKKEALNLLFELLFCFVRIEKGDEYAL